MKSTLLSSVVALLLFGGCGGSSTDKLESNLDTSTNTESKKVGKGYYVDASVNGINYHCGSEIGVTDENGTFLFEEGKDCTFKIGDLVLRDINASSLEDNITIFEDNVEVAQLLQTLDMDGNASNGITIDNNASSTVVKDINIEEIPTDIAVLDAIKEGLKAENEDYNGTVKTKEEAKAHLKSTEQDLNDKGVKTQIRLENENGDKDVKGGQDANETRPTNGDKNANAGEDGNATRPANGDKDANGGKDANENRPANGDKDANGGKDANENRR